MLCLAAAGCSRHATPAVLFDSATQLFRQGAYPAAQRKASLGYSEFQAQPGSEWFWKFRLLLADIDLRNGDTSEANRLLSKEPPAKYRESFIRYRILRSYGLYRDQKTAAADSELQAAAQQAHQIGAWDLEADAENLRGSRVTSSDPSDAALHKAVQIAIERHLPFQETEAWLNLGFMRYYRDFYGDAIPYLERAAELAKRMGFAEELRNADQNEADCFREMGDVDRALKIQVDVVAAEEKAGARTTLSNAYIDLGASYLLKQDSARAIECFRKALRSVKAREASVQFTLSANSLAQALESTGALDEAQRYNEMALQACNKADLPQLAELALTSAAIATHRGRYDDALASYRQAIAADSRTPSVLWEAHAGLGSAYAKTGDVADARAHFEQALSIIEQNRADQLKRDYEVMFLSNLIRFYQEYVTVLMSQGEVERAIEVADSSRAGVLTQNVAGTDRVVRSGRLVQQVQHEAGLTNSVFLFYWLAPAQSYLWVLTANAVNTIQLPDQHGIAQDVASYLSLLVDEKRDPLAGSNPVGKRLYQALIAPAEPWLPRGARVVIVPDGALHNLNFEMLLADKPEPHYWIQDVVISVAPSLSILGRNTKPRAGLQPSLLLMGDAEPAPGYPKLPQSALELEDVEHHFPAAGTTVYRGPAATVDCYRNAGPNRFSSIHFAAHGEANEQSPLDSAIILSPQANGYKLYARDVMDIPITADLVTISACRGVGARPFSGEGLVGFAWAFFQAGARNVVTSLWDVNDRTTAELMDRFYGRVQAGEPYANALRDAKLAALQSGNGKPYFWAPFQLYTRVASRN
ncbi:MAG TPA: CHAT domain-containing tetratricopeptide repeat protein [Bryobacteraceae bacterium]|nr:CHAT domain-containing tetratricopeptide repeat protein [Bryobacteraceae bacterium]